MELLKIENLKKTFGQNSVLTDVSLSVNSGEVVSVIGSSGSGKSTLLRCATMLEKADGGSISYAGDIMCREENGTKQIPALTELIRLPF